jgi:hypothetical protein
MKEVQAEAHNICYCRYIQGDKVFLNTKRDNNVTEKKNEKYK